MSLSSCQPLPVGPTELVPEMDILLKFRNEQRGWVGIQWRKDDLSFDFQTYPNYQKLQKISNKTTTAAQNLRSIESQSSLGRNQCSLLMNQVKRNCATFLHGLGTWKPKQKPLSSKASSSSQHESILKSPASGF